MVDVSFIRMSYNITMFLVSFASTIIFVTTFFSPFASTISLSHTHLIGKWQKGIKNIVMLYEILMDTFIMFENQCQDPKFYY